MQLTPKLQNVEIHRFSDASQAAMSAVIYFWVPQPTGPAFISLSCSKTKVAPLKCLTIPRLELSAALLLWKLVSHVSSILHLSHVATYLWTDSSATLAWVNSEPNKWKEFVKNRAEVIQNLTSSTTWRYITGKRNPADCAYRGLSASPLISHLLWWSGPA